MNQTVKQDVIAVEPFEDFEAARLFVEKWRSRLDAGTAFAITDDGEVDWKSLFRPNRPIDSAWDRLSIVTSNAPSPYVVVSRFPEGSLRDDLPESNEPLRAIRVPR